MHDDTYISELLHSLREAAARPHSIGHAEQTRILNQAVWAIDRLQRLGDRLAEHAPIKEPAVADYIRFVSTGSSNPTQHPTYGHWTAYVETERTRQLEKRTEA